MSNSHESSHAPLPAAAADVPGFLCVDHVAIAVKAGDLDAQAAAYRLLGFTEVHREEVHGGDQVREVLLRIGDGPNLIQLLEPLAARVAGAEADRSQRRPRRLRPRRVQRVGHPGRRSTT